MKAAFFHGLESQPKSEKNIILEKAFDEVYAPAMQYKDPQCFLKVKKYIAEYQPDILIGSSMGGYFAYCLSTIYNIPTLLFNPAVIDRSIEPIVDLGDYMPKQTVILGNKDSVIDCNKSLAWFYDSPKKNFEIHWEKMGHRIPHKIFEKWIINQSKL